MTELTLQLTEAVAQRAVLLASLEGRSAEEYLASLVEKELSPTVDQHLESVAALSDEDVLGLADSMMPEHEQSRLSQLLEANGESTLTPSERVDLDRLMQLYSEGNLRKALGWAEAVRRKLRPPLGP